MDSQLEGSEENVFGVPRLGEFASCHICRQGSYDTQEYLRHWYLTHKNPAEKQRLSEAYMEVVKKNEAEGRRKNEAKKGNGQDGGPGTTKKAKEAASGATASRRGARTTTQAKAVGRRSSR